MYRSIVRNIMTTKKTTTATESKVKQPKLKLKNVEVVFVNLEDEGFGRSITIKVTGDNEKMINDFFKAKMKKLSTNFSGSIKLAMKSQGLLESPITKSMRARSNSPSG